MWYVTLGESELDIWYNYAKSHLHEKDHFAKLMKSVGKSPVIDRPIDNSHYRLILKLGKEMQINHHKRAYCTKISKIAKFGCEML
jgi:hypothetical protein